MAQDTAITPYYWDAESNTMQPFTGNYKAANGFINIAVERTEDAADAVRILMQLSEANTSPNTQFVCIFPKNVEFPDDYYSSNETEKWAKHSISMSHAPQEATNGLTGLRQWFEANEVRRAERRERVKEIRAQFGQTSSRDESTALAPALQISAVSAEIDSPAKDKGRG